jgi:tetratricopeptide (TPR) repeat protein
MENPNFLIWATVVFGIASFAIGSMLNAFRRPIAEVPFAEAAIADLTIPLSEAARMQFVGAVGTYRAGDYRGAIAQLSELVEQAPNCAEAWHNLGLAYANIGDNNKAVRSLLKASDAYDQQDTKAGIDRIKQDLETLKELSQKNFSKSPQ